MKIVVLDGYTENPGDLSWDALKELGDVTVYDRTSYEESPLIAERIGDAEIVIINKTPISKETIDKCPNMKLIAVLATGYNVVDYNYAKEKDIPVVNVPTYGTQIVGQYALGLLLEICSHYGHHDETVKAGKWENNDDWCYWDIFLFCIVVINNIITGSQNSDQFHVRALVDGLFGDRSLVDDNDLCITDTLRDQRRLFVGSSVINSNVSQLF